VRSGQTGAGTHKSHITHESQETTETDWTKNSRYLQRKLQKAMAAEPVQELTEEDKLLAMLGHKTTVSGARAPYLYREDFCGACGLQHAYPGLMDMFPFCANCVCALREPAHLRDRMKDVPQTVPLEIIIGSYGHAQDPGRIVVITEQLKELALEFRTKDRISLKPSYDLSKLFGADPCPGENKYIKFRYRVNGVHGWAQFSVFPTNNVPFPILFIAPKERLVKIIRATWGHPRGRSTTGRMSIEVTEQIQGLADIHGGAYVELDTNRSMTDLFGDPCPGYPKDLLVEYDIAGLSGKRTWPETHGYLSKSAFIETAPIVNPLIYVNSATYGVTEHGRKDQIQNIKKKQSVITQIEHRRSLGMLIQNEELKIVKNKPIYAAQRKYFREVAQDNALDITKKMQRLADASGGAILRLEKEKFDPNLVFGNPLPGGLKLLECSLMCYGHDSERETDSYEMTPSGFPRNLIQGKNARFNIVVKDDPETGRGILQEDLVFETYNAAPLIQIAKALYGHPTDLSRSIDVTAKVQQFVVGRRLVIPREINLDDLFSNPCPGARKTLRVGNIFSDHLGSLSQPYLYIGFSHVCFAYSSLFFLSICLLFLSILLLTYLWWYPFCPVQVFYITCGFLGTMRVRCTKEDTLVAALQLGYPPVPPRDEQDGY
jgi:hypothetical protein